MKEKKTVFKLFFVWDFEKEERWLNEMAQEGWVLDTTGSVSYTHLDVYKRQVYTCPLLRRWTYYQHVQAFNLCLQYRFFSFRCV